MVGPVPGNQRAQAADERTAEHRRYRAPHFFSGRPHVLEGDLGIFGVDGGNLIDAVHELGNAEQAERQRDQFDAVLEMEHPEGEAFGAGLHVGADNAEHQTEHGHGDALERRAARQRRAGKQAKQHQRRDFGRAEFQRHRDQDRRPEKSSP